MLEITNHLVQVKKSDKKRGLVYGIVYAPNLIDAHSDMMLPEDVELMAHGFISKGEFDVFDTDHDNWPTGTRPVESFIARKGDPDFPEGAWVLGVKVEDAVLTKIEKGEINGFSFQGKVLKSQALVEIEYNPTIIGVTEAAEDGHVHSFVVKADENGKPEWGRTSPAADGHFHEIVRGTATATGGADNHKHRINLKLV